MKNYLTLTAVTFALLLSACGFEPLYAENENSKSILVGSSFKVDKVDFGHPGQKLQYRLEDLLNHGKSETKKYRLKTTLSKTKDGIGIQKDRYITRYNIRVRAYYEVFDIASGKKIFDGSSNMTGGFDADDSQFATYSAEENTTLSLMDELAKDMVLSIATKLSDSKPVEKLVEEQAAKDKLNPPAKTKK